MVGKETVGTAERNQQQQNGLFYTNCKVDFLKKNWAKNV